MTCVDVDMDLDFDGYLLFAGYSGVTIYDKISLRSIKLYDYGGNNLYKQEEISKYEEERN